MNSQERVQKCSILWVFAAYFCPSPYSLHGCFLMTLSICLTSINRCSLLILILRHIYNTLTEASFLTFLNSTVTSFRCLLIVCEKKKKIILKTVNEEVSVLGVKTHSSPLHGYQNNLINQKNTISRRHGAVWFLLHASLIKKSIWGSHHYYEPKKCSHHMLEDNFFSGPHHFYDWFLLLTLKEGQTV